MASMNESDGDVEVCAAGEKIHVPRLKIRDYLPWLAELQAERKTHSVKLIPGGLPAIERFKLLRNIEFDQPSPDDIVPLLYTAPGQIRVIETAIVKAKDKTMADKIIDDLTAAQSKRLAFEISGLFTASQLAEIFIPDPNQKEPQPADPSTTFGGAGPLASPAASPAAG